jgi:hypothetical protein
MPRTTPKTDLWSAVARRNLFAFMGGLSAALVLGWADTALAQHDKVLVESRLNVLKGHYAEVKVATGRYSPVKPGDSPALKNNRTELAETMRAFEALEAKAQGLQAKPGAMSEMSETQSLELQMTMDRMSKLLETMSNIMKKMSDTGSSIIQNMK